MRDQLDAGGAARAVGAGCSSNPLPILVPCHRVVPGSGGFGGYRGGEDWKRYLLELESSARA
nr:methylated-DNA--[protein]-cysteine S-methyltransferase [Auritidibacter sp. NML130574]